VRDCGRWRELGVTHWHLTVDEVDVNDPSRYSRERWEQIVASGYAGTTDDPREALRWIDEQRRAAVRRAADPEWVARRAGLGTPEGRRLQSETTWFMLTCTATPAGGGIAVSDGRSVEIYANPMTARTCGRKH
jgi:hypothetical protein